MLGLNLTEGFDLLDDFFVLGNNGLSSVIAASLNQKRRAIGCHSETSTSVHYIWTGMTCQLGVGESDSCTCIVDSDIHPHEFPANNWRVLTLVGKQVP